MNAAPQRLIDNFLHFALSARPTSPLSAALAEGVVGDAELLSLAAEIPADKLPPNMLLAAVHALLPTDDPLACFYASRTAEPLPPEGAFPDFRRFALSHREAILDLCRTRRTSTNEVQRAAVLMPAFGLVARAGEPLHMIEVGAAAGLLLNWDRIAYDYDTAGRLAPPDAAFTLRCEARGPLPLPAAMPRVARRVGLDLVSLDPAKAEDAAWLRALIWPELKARRERLDQAIALARRHPVRHVIGDAIETLPREIAAVPSGDPLVVFHSFALAQFPAALKQAFLALLDELGRQRPLWRVGYEHGPKELAYLSLQRHGRGEAEQVLAEATPHGQRLRWLEAAPR
ncbi:MAG TPA: DUF2332 domain-containing protein [Kiloniellales bacterium]|nr:DUF2332 domain-containing protein [Kiloniellales bacterium]